MTNRRVAPADGVAWITGASSGIGRGVGEEVIPEFGWIEQPIPSAEENCLTWDITVSRGGASPRGRQAIISSHYQNDLT